MKARHLTRALATVLVVVMLIGVLPMSAFAALRYDEDGTTDDYYKLISQRNWQLAPGIEETEIVLNNDQGSRRQVLHTAKIDMNNPYTKVIPGYKGMIPTMGNYGTQSTSAQALEAEKLGYGNVVVATNAMLSWYDTAYYKEHPEYIGEPLGWNMLNGYYYENSQGKLGLMSSSYAAIVINYDVHPVTGEQRPADIPKVQMRGIAEPMTGWEENALSVWGWLVKPDANGVPQNQYSKDHGSGVASRTFVGVTADGEIILSVSDGEQAPYSTGFTMYEMADYMIKMGCVYAANCDGGGSTTFVSQRPGEDLKVNCSLADGGERPTTNTFLVISTAPDDGEFAQATVSSDYNYYTPGSSVTFHALGTDAVGTKVDIPDDVTWAIKEEGMGTIENGVFTSNGTEGTVTAQMIYNGKVVGECTVYIATPDAISFEQPIVTVPFGKTATIPVKATVNNGLHEIGLGPNDVTFTIDNADLGTFDGLQFVAVDEDHAPANLVGNVTATLNMGSKPTANVQFKLGKGSVVLWDFEGGQADIDEWNVINNRTGTPWAYDLNLSLADRTNGQVHDGNYSMRLETNGLHSQDSHSKQYAYIRLGVDGDAVILENARSVGFWLYVPEDNIQCWVQGHYKFDSTGDGVLDSTATVNMMDSENVYYNIDESGWHYLEMDVSAYEKIALAYSQQFPKNDGTGTKGEFFIALVFHKAINNILWQTNGSINGPYTYYIDNFTVDYSDAVDDREEPIIEKIYANGTPLVKRDVFVTTSNVLNFSSAVADASVKKDADKVEHALTNISGLNESSAKVYIDGVEIPCTVSNGKMNATATVADGYHRVKFEICDNAGNKAVMIRVIKVESGSDASTLKLVPADATLDRIPFGSIYWMNLEANKIETIQSVSTIIDLNNVNHWQLDHMELAEGFTAEYSIVAETNTAHITITRTGDNDMTGEAILAKIPVRIIDFDNDMRIPGKTAATVWTNFEFWPQDMKMDVDKGEITFVDGYTSPALNVFSNEEFHVDTEMYTHHDGMDKTYWAEHLTTHVHTPVALDDKAPTCTENGYTDRTFCYACNSVVEWGTTIPATGHVYHVNADKLVCDCGKEFRGTGLQTADGKSYYTVNGKLTGGWLTIGDDWYYFDTENYASCETYNNGFVTYRFEADGKLISGEWYHSAQGHKYYLGPSYLRGGKNVMTWYTIDGKDYCIEKSGYVATGTRWVNADDANQEVYKWYNFDEYGVCQGEWNYTGLAEWNGNVYYVKNGVSKYGMYWVDGAYYYMYFTNNFAARKNEEFYCHYNNGLLPEGDYCFGADSKMVDKNIVNLNGTLYYCEVGQKTQGTGSFNYDGTEYTIENDGKVLLTGFWTDAAGKTEYFVDGVYTYLPKNGIYEENGNLYYYENDVRVQKGLVQDENGDYYYFGLRYYAVKNGVFYFPAEKMNGLYPTGGTFTVAADGKVSFN